MSDNADPVERQTYTIMEAAMILGVSRNTAYEAAKRREIPTISVRGRRLVPKQALHRLIDGR